MFNRLVIELAYSIMLAIRKILTIFINMYLELKKNVRKLKPILNLRDQKGNLKICIYIICHKQKKNCTKCN